MYYVQSGVKTSMCKYTRLQSKWALDLVLCILYNTKVRTHVNLYIYYIVSEKQSRGDRLNAHCIHYGKK